MKMVINAALLASASVSSEKVILDRLTPDKVARIRSVRAIRTAPLNAQFNIGAASYGAPSIQLTTSSGSILGPGDSGLIAGVLEVGELTAFNTATGDHYISFSGRSVDVAGSGVVFGDQELYVVSSWSYAATGSAWIEVEYDVDNISDLEYIVRRL